MSETNLNSALPPPNRQPDFSDPSVPTEPVLDPDEDLTPELAAALARVLQRERERQKARQAAGIAAAKQRGVKFGRPSVGTPPNFGAIVEAWEQKQLSVHTAVRLCGMSEATFFRRVRAYRKQLQP